MVKKRHNITRRNMKTEILIVVEGGTVVGVYSTNPDVEVDILDRDTQEEADEAAADELEEKIGTMHEVG
jgi:hypothetical protein